MKRSKFAVTMYIITALTALFTGVSACLYVSTEQSFWMSVAITFGTSFYHFGMRLLVGSLVPNCFQGSGRWFRQHPWEQKLYAMLRVKHWKKLLPAYDPTLFSLQEHSMEQIACHMCQAEVVHEIIVLCSFLPLLFALLFGEFWIFLITSILAAAFDLLFVIMQRYNRPRLFRILLAKERSSGND